MSCIGKEIVEDAARGPIVDVMSDKDLVTNAAILQVSIAFLYNFLSRNIILLNPIIMMRGIITHILIYYSIYLQYVSRK